MDISRILGQERRCILLVSASLFLSVLIPVFGHTRAGDLSDHFGDHLHHTWATDIFFHRGLDIYRHNFGELWPGSTFPQKEEAWGNMARPYPPGVFAAFAPLALLARAVPMSKATFGAIAIVYLLLLTHVGFLGLCRLLQRSSPGVRLLLGGLLWAALLHLALEGFYDPLWLGCGIAMASALHDGRPTSALRWFAVASLLHFRAITLAPMAGLALWRALRPKPWRQWPWATVVGLVLVLAVVVFTFSLVYPQTASRRALHPSWPALVHMGEFGAVVAVTIVGCAGALLLRDFVLAGAMLIVGVLAIVDLGVYRGYWHHAAIATVALISTLSVDDDRSERRRQLAVLWQLAIMPIVWLGNPAALIIDLAKSFRPHF